jgi:hypothetical protein
MDDERLVELNFCSILHYGGQPPRYYQQPEPIPCEGYCVSCEESGLLEGTGKRLDLMSHGCDSSDFEKVLGQMPGNQNQTAVKKPILFLLEAPGGDWTFPGGDRRAAEPVPFRGRNKRPPVNHYYWTPSVTFWPTCLAHLQEADAGRGDYYGAYFAYLMQRHQLRKVYITNTVKCKWVPSNRAGITPIVDHCVRQYLREEIRFFRPRIVFCFGRHAQNNLERLRDICAYQNQIVYLRHPSALANARRYRRCTADMIAENDEFVEEAIRQVR